MPGRPALAAVATLAAVLLAGGCTVLLAGGCTAMYNLGPRSAATFGQGPGFDVAVSGDTMVVSTTDGLVAYKLPTTGKSMDSVPAPADCQWVEEVGEINIRQLSISASAVEPSGSKSAVEGARVKRQDHHCR